MSQGIVMNEEKLKKLKILNDLLIDLNKKVEYLYTIVNADVITVIDTLNNEAEKTTFTNAKKNVIDQLKEIKTFVNAHPFLKPLIKCNNDNQGEYSCKTIDLNDTILSYNNEIEPLNNSNLKNKILFIKSGIGILYLHYTLEIVLEKGNKVETDSKKEAGSYLKGLFDFADKNEFVKIIVTKSNLKGIYSKHNDNDPSSSATEEKMLTTYLRDNVNLVKNIDEIKTAMNGEIPDYLNIVTAVTTVTPRPPAAPATAAPTASTAPPTPTAVATTHSSSAPPPPPPYSAPASTAAPVTAAPVTAAPVSSTPGSSSSSAAAIKPSAYNTVTVDDENLKQINDVVITARYNKDEHALEFKELKIMTSETPQQVETYTITKTGLKSAPVGSSSTFKDNLESNKNPINFGYEEKIRKKGSFFGDKIEVSRDITFATNSNLKAIENKNWTKKNVQILLKEMPNLREAAINSLKEETEGNKFMMHFRKGIKNGDTDTDDNILSEYIVYKSADAETKQKIEEYFNKSRIARFFTTTNKQSILKGNTLFDKQQGGSKTKKYRKRITKRKRKYRYLTRRG